MTNRRMFLATATAVLAVSPLARAFAQAGGDRATAFVKSVGEQLIGVINGAGDPPQQHAELTRIIDASVDIDGVARFCIGRFWRTASPQEQRDYVEAFHAMLVNNISAAVGSYQGVRFSVGRAQPRADGTVVTTTITRPNNKPSPVDWLIAEVGGNPRIEDMITEGVSLRLTQRSDYEAFLASNGHTVRSLIDGLRQKAAAHA